MAPRLTVGITYHDERELVQECLHSLLSQTAPPEEVIVYDDASAAPAADYIPADPRIRIVRGDRNLGPGPARNRILQSARSDYVHFHDADDLFHPDWCAEVRHALARNESEAVFTEVSSSRHGRILCERVLGLAALTDGHDLVRFCIRGSLLVPSGTYRRDAIRRVGGYREGLSQSEDFDFHVRLAASGISFVIIDRPLVHIRVRTESRSQNHLEVWLDALQAIELLAAELPARYRQDLAERCAGAGMMLHHLHAHEASRRAFDLARELGAPSYSGRPPAYRFVAGAFSPFLAETLASMYRAMLPIVLRKSLRGGS
jgi:glycosyltransferase involved in cell wall biosynthesis